MTKTAAAKKSKANAPARAAKKDKAKAPAPAVNKDVTKVAAAGVKRKSSRPTPEQEEDKKKKDSIKLAQSYPGESSQYIQSHVLFALCSLLSPCG
jgi:hypothetical protein